MTHVREIITITGPAYWASAIINGDFSGLDDNEAKACRAWLERECGDAYEIVDIARDEDGEAKEARFTWSFSLYGGTAQGGDVMDYVAISLD